MPEVEDVTPNPEYLIKSIAEQGYSLQSALADLIDNSISAHADKVEILTKMDKEPFALYLADNGEGMDEKTLKSSMRFPSNSPESTRDNSDLGRFGLGMKTASFSQTRKFTVISKPKGSLRFSGRTWDLNFLKDNKWNLIINTEDEINAILADYKKQSSEHLNRFEDFEANTVIVWSGLYKFEQYIEEKNRVKAFQKEISEITSEHLSLVFHRFMEAPGNPLNIRINNRLLTPFNPFPIDEEGLRYVEPKQKLFAKDSVKLEGFILPSRSIEETKDNNNTKWTTKNRSLTDMEGIYIYRANRIILFGGWNGVIKKAPRLQLARLRVEIGNQVDHLLHLNVAKSQVIIPHDLQAAFENYINDLKEEAIKEFYNRRIDRLPVKNKKKTSLFEKVSSNKGTLLELNTDFPILELLRKNLSSNDNAKLNTLIKMINTEINRIRQVHHEKAFIGIEVQDGLSHEDLKTCILELLDTGLDARIIKDKILPDLGFDPKSLPADIDNLLTKGK